MAQQRQENAAKMKLERQKLNKKGS
jgi:hypothetical protein